MEDHDLQIERARLILDRVEKKTAGYKGDCEDCIHSRGNKICTHPIVEASSMLSPQGYKRDRNVECDYQRGEGYNIYGPRVCSPNGFLFESERVKTKEPGENRQGFFGWIKNLFS